jgi:hypothetical protein
MRLQQRVPKLISIWKVVFLAHHPIEHVHVIALVEWPNWSGLPTPGHCGWDRETGVRDDHGLELPTEPAGGQVRDLLECICRPSTDGTAPDLISQLLPHGALYKQLYCEIQKKPPLGSNLNILYESVDVYSMASPGGVIQMQSMSVHPRLLFDRQYTTYWLQRLALRCTSNRLDLFVLLCVFVIDAECMHIIQTHRPGTNTV